MAQLGDIVIAGYDASAEVEVENWEDVAGVACCGEFLDEFLCDRGCCVVHMGRMSK